MIKTLRYAMVVILTSIVLMVVGIPGIMRSFNQTDLISTHHQHVDLEFEGPRGVEEKAMLPTP